MLGGFSESAVDAPHYRLQADAMLILTPDLDDGVGVLLLYLLQLRLQLFSTLPVPRRNCLGAVDGEPVSITPSAGDTPSLVADSRGC
jgi:hypothetical protein